MSILDHAITNRHLRDRPRYEPLRVALNTEPTGEIRPGTLDKNREYELLATLSVIFWANDVQKPEAERAARKTMLHNLYGDALRHISGLRTALFGHDIETALAICDAIEETFGLKEPGS